MCNPRTGAAWRCTKPRFATLPPQPQLTFAGATRAPTRLVIMTVESPTARALPCSPGARIGHGRHMPRIQVDTESLTAGGAQQSAAGGQALEAAGALEAAIAAAADAVGDAGAGGAVGDW